MWIQPNTQILIQGITGKEGQRVLGWLQKSGMNVVAGVTPGKEGQEVAGVPVFGSVAAAKAQFASIEITSLYVPPKFALAAAIEAIEAKIPIIHIFAENIPVADTFKILELADQAGVRVLGPSAIGWAEPGLGRVGSLGGEDLDSLLAPDSRGGVAILSKSGGMANTIAEMFTQAQIGQSLVMGIGGDRLIGTTFADLLPDLAADQRTKAVVVIGEIGGAYEEVLAEQIIIQKFNKPVVAFISGIFAETLPQGVAFGHAGAIVSKSEGTRRGKITALEGAGATVVATPSDLVSSVKRLLSW